MTLLDRVIDGDGVFEAEDETDLELDADLVED